MKIMGTGSRSALTSTTPKPKTIYKNLEEYILQLQDVHDNLVLISGMAEGWDEMLAAVGKRNEIPYVCVLPTRDYVNYYWGRTSLLKVNRIPSAEDLLNDAFQVIYLEELYGEPRFFGRGYRGIIPGPNYNINGVWVHANMQRNQVMVDLCDAAVVFSPNSSGTKDGVARLLKASKPYDIYPFKLRVLAVHEF